MANERQTPPFGTLVAAGLVAIAIWQITVFLWRTFGWATLLAPALILILLNLTNLSKYWIDGWRGLDQWPEPHGRFYNQWMKLPEGVGDYYDWLAQQKGNREPWTTWARMHRSLVQQQE